MREGPSLGTMKLREVPLTALVFRLSAAAPRCAGLPGQWRGGAAQLRAGGSRHGDREEADRGRHVTSVLQCCTMSI